MKRPLVILLAAQTVVTLLALVFTLTRGHGEAAQSKPHADEEHAAVPVDAGHHEVAAQGPFVPPDAGEWAQFPTPGASTAVVAVAASPAPAACPPPVQQAHAAAPVEEKVDRETLMAELRAGNTRFVQGVSKQRDLLARRASLAGAERASAVVVTCTDSRVVPELLFDQPLGTFAVVRTPGAQIDEVSARAVEESVTRLGAKVILVLGHLGCHHVSQALRTDKKTPRAGTLASILRSAAAGLQGEALDLSATTASLSVATQELRRRSKVLTRATDVSTHRVIYAPQSGEVRWLDVESTPQPKAARR